MNRFQIRQFYILSCNQELSVLKPGNLNTESNLSGMRKEKFQRAAKISSDILIKKKNSLGESIYLACENCIKELGENYNLGIILLCAPIIKVATENNFIRIEEFRKKLKKTLCSIDNKDSELIIEAIKISRPAGLNNFDLKGDILKNSTKNTSFYNLAKISQHYDRISRCYACNYKEIFEIALPYYKFQKRIFSEKISIEKLFIKLMSNDFDSHILRKFGVNIARSVCFKSKFVNNIINNNSQKYFNFYLKKFDRYLKLLKINPGTCADLTVTTLLMDKITDIVKY